MTSMLAIPGFYVSLPGLSTSYDVPDLLLHLLQKIAIFLAEIQLVNSVHYLFILVSLYAFWLLLSGYYVPLLLTLGGGSALVVVWLLRRMDQVDAAPITLRPGFKLLRYFVWLLGQVVKANIDVARRIWDPKLPIQPSWDRLDIKVTSDLEKTIYANSITLTPGTLTTDVKDDHFMIHNLSPEGMESLRAGEMQRRIMDIGL